MKNKYVLTILLLIFTGSFLTAQSYTQESQEQEEDINLKTGFPEIKEKPYIIFDEGIAFSQITRIEVQDSRSNFVREDYLIGAYWGFQTRNMKPVDSILLFSAYYPFYHTFNGMKQSAKQVLLYAFDIFYAPLFETDMWKYVRIKFAPGPHTMYQLTDEYHMVYFGIAFLLGAELPLSKYWTILTDGFLTVDYANLGSNRKIQPFDYSWQYRLNVGIRYSKRDENQFSYINSRKK